MTPAARLQASLDLYYEVEGADRPADAVTSAFFRSRRHIPEADRGAILEQLYGLLRHRMRLTWRLARLGHEDRPRARFLAFMALVEGKSPEHVARLFDGALTDRDHALLVALKGGTVDHPEMPEATRLECPDWALAPLRRRFGEAFAAELAAMLVPPPLDLRVNPIKTTRESMLRALTRQGIAADATDHAPHGIRLRERMSLTHLPGLKTGEVEIQDEGSQLVAALVDARTGERVVDFCAGAGGKTLALAAQMQNKGHVMACDTNEARLKRAAERLRKAGLHNVETKVISGETDKWIKRHKLAYDRVLIDAPCSGTGTWRRNPDARGRAPDLGLEGLMALQGRILTSAARLVKPGGRLVYATCSVLIEENEDQVAAFLTANPGFRRVPVALAGLEGEYLSLTPLRHGTDGFFAAVLERLPPTA